MGWGGRTQSGSPMRSWTLVHRSEHVASQDTIVRGGNEVCTGLSVFAAALRAGISLLTMSYYGSRHRSQRPINSTSR